jgi:hypothetical protein
MNSANDILAYMSQVSEAGNELSETNNIRELMAQAKDTALMAKTGAKASIGEIGGELGIEGILGLAKSTLETAGQTAKDAVTSFLGDKTGLSSETLSKFASGDIEGGLMSAKNDLVGKAEQLIQDNIPDISQDQAIAMGRMALRPQPTQEDLPEGSGAIQERIAPSPEDLNDGIASDLEAQNQYQEMVDTQVSDSVAPDLELKNVVGDMPDDTGEVSASAGDLAEEAGSALTDAIPDIIGAGSEAVGEALDLTPLAPLGLLIGILGPVIGGIVSAKEEASHASDVVNSLVQQVQVVNPSSQFL